MARKQSPVNGRAATDEECFIGTVFNKQLRSKDHLINQGTNLGSLMCIERSVDFLFPGIQHGTDLHTAKRSLQGETFKGRNRDDRFIHRKSQSLDGRYSDPQASKSPRAGNHAKTIQFAEFQSGISQQVIGRLQQPVTGRSGRIQTEFTEQLVARCQSDTPAWRCRLNRQESGLHTLAPKDAYDIIIEGQNHQQKQKYEPDLLSNFAGTHRQRLPEDQFKQVKKQMAAVKYRDRQKVQNP